MARERGLALLVLFGPARPTIHRSRWGGGGIALALGNQVATGEAEMQEYAVTGHTEDFAQELLLRGRVMG